MIIVAVIAPLAVIGLCCPCIFICLDKNDYEALEMDSFDISDEICDQVMQKRNYSCIQEVYYRLKELDKFKGITDEQEFRSGSWLAFKAFMRSQHPCYSLFTRFDYRFKRAMRFFIVLAQICIITLLCWAAYSVEAKKYKTLTDLKEYKAYWVSLVLGFLTLPLPRLLNGCCMTELYVMKEEKKERQKLFGDENAEEVQADIDQQSTEETPQPKAALIDQFYLLKAFFLIMVFIFYCGTVAISVLFWIQSGQKAKDSLESINIIELTAEEAQEFVLCWYLSIFVVGWGVYNNVRVYIIGFFAPNVAHEKYNMSEEDQAGICASCSCVTTLLIPPESVEQALDAIAIINVQGNPTKKGDDDDPVDEGEIVQENA